MNRSLLIALSCSWLCISDLPAYETEPNVVFIMADDLGYGDLSCYDGWIKTPNIDSIAANGIRFTDYHSNGNVCSPTRAALMTGLYQQKVGIPFVVVAAEKNKAHFVKFALGGVRGVRSWPENPAVFGRERKNDIWENIILDDIRELFVGQQIIVVT